MIKILIKIFGYLSITLSLFSVGVGITFLLLGKSTTYSSLALVLGLICILTACYALRRSQRD